jgi:hypothetical protein
MFSVVGVLRGYYTDNREDAVLMALDLGPMARRWKSRGRRGLDTSDK